MTAAAAACLAITSVLPLHGRWRRGVRGEAIDEVAVPGSYPPIGACELEREVALPAEWLRGGRVFLRTEGVLASAEFSIDGTVLGRATAWSPHEFELPRALLRSRLSVRASMRDISESFGPTPGRRFDAGLIRDIRLERRAETFVADVQWRAQLDADLGGADCVVAIRIDGAESMPASIRLRERRPGGATIAEERIESARGLRLRVERPLLWSPDRPQLYDLSVTLANGESWSEAVGFRELEARGPDLWLNGERLVLRGVCRHEFMEGHGYSPPEEAVRRELEAIRHAGFNYVRLVHSPQARCVPRIAAEIGLLVSEEPGTCFHDLGDEAVAGPALEALHRMVERDRNLPSVLAWFIYNECLPHLGYAQRAAAVCRELDPGRLLSFADCSGRHAEVRAMVEGAGLSFVGLNVYSITPNAYRAPMDTFAGIPLVYTEWGAGIWSSNERGLDALCRMFAQHAREDEPQRVAGCSYWCWSDYEEYSREEPCAIDGWTIQGLVDAQSREKPELSRLSRLCFELAHPPTPAPPTVRRLIADIEVDARWRTIALDEVDGDQRALDEALVAMRRKYRGAFPALGAFALGGIVFAARGGEGPARPLLIGEGRAELRIPIDAEVRGLAILGHTSFVAGYPCSIIHSVHHADAEPPRACGDAAGEYDLIFDDGVETIALAHGLDVLRANAICRWWKLDPRAPRTRPALRAVIHPSYEELRIDLWRREWPRARRLRELRWRSRDPQAIQPLYALSVLI